MRMISTSLLIIFFPLSAGWILVDSAKIGVRVKAGDYCDFALDPKGDSIVVTTPDPGLTSLAQQAVARAPQWLKIELTDNFSRLTDSLQDTLSKIILNCEPRYLDEICFTTGHLAPQTLSNSYFDPELILYNVQILYANDDSLDYVQIVDFPDSSTTRYFVAESTPAGIDTSEVQLPKEIYYWYIVHPKLHKELPAYIDPNTGNPSPNGYFWRDYLFNHADPGYPLLRDSVIGVKTLWNSKRNSLDNGALGRATGWIQDVMEFVTYPHHDQPVRIYHLHKGTCSVHSYLSAATARTLLIPGTVTAAYRYDHKWNEFYDRRWIQWEPVNTWMDYYPYDHWGGGDNIPGCFDWRGDGYIWTMAERYTPVCTLTVKVEDRNGIAIDGGRIVIDSPGYPGPRVTAGWTDDDGTCRFLLGDSCGWFSAQVATKIGGLPPTTVINNPQPGVHYQWTAKVDGDMPVLKVSHESAPAGTTYKFELSLSVPLQLLYGTNPDDGDIFSKTLTPGKIDLFICDSSNFEKYVLGDSFKSPLIAKDIQSFDSSFILPTAEPWHLVITNEEKVVLTQYLDLSLKLYKYKIGVEEQPDLVFNDLKIRPIPFRDYLKIGPVPVGTRISIFDPSGRLVKEFTADKGKIIWKALLPEGIYFLKLSYHLKEVIRKIVLIR